MVARFGRSEDATTPRRQGPIEEVVQDLLRLESISLTGRVVVLPGKIILRYPARSISRDARSRLLSVVVLKSPPTTVASRETDRLSINART